MQVNDWDNRSEQEASVTTAHEMRNAADYLVSEGRANEAVALFQRLLEKNPDDSGLLHDFGEILLSQNRLEEAADVFRAVLSNNPSDAAGTIMLATVLYRLKQWEESLHFFRLATRRAPHLAIVHHMAGLAAYKADRRNEAQAAFEAASNTDPDFIPARFCLCMSHLTMYSSEAELDAGRQRYAETLYDIAQNARVDASADIELAVEAIGTLTSFFLPYQGLNDRILQKTYGEWISQVMLTKLPQYGQELSSRPTAGEKLRIGFVSGHFYRHSVWKIITRGWLAQLDRTRFELNCYYCGNVLDTDTDTARNMSDVFVRSTDIGELAGIISRHAPHVLIYPGIGMDPFTIRLAALRLAPVQCVSWGHPETTGLPNIDYFLSSDLMEPADGDDHYTEQLIRLPNLSVCYDPLQLPPPLPHYRIPGIDRANTSFLCCQNLMKYLPQHDDVFPSIARLAPQSKFVFIQATPALTDCFDKRLRTAFARQGISAADHVIFVPPQNAAEYAALNETIDIFLDSIGWAGGNTVLESLPFNKPIATLPGDFMRGRHATAILKMMGVEETIATDKQEYIRIAARLANDLDWRNFISARIASRKHRVYGDRQCITALESFLDEAVRRKAQVYAVSAECSP